jgi:hypothetical protein
MYYLLLGTISLLASQPNMDEDKLVFIVISLFCSILSLTLYLGKIGKQKKNDEEII